ncbi:MAG TPA: aldo/keto reductase [Acidimicrobiia bacterium]|nr:aldo/keto reductase [Acidimicrobiia bacterium]
MARGSLEPRPLGESGLEVTALGLGLAALGRPAYINLGREVGEAPSVAEMRDLTHAMLDAAYDTGIRYVDAARSYGRSEEFLASWLERRRPSRLTVGSKWGYRYIGEWRTDAEVHEVKDHSFGMLEKQLAESRALLGDHLDLYQIHSATPESGVLDDRAVLARLAELRSDGLVIGLSVSGSDQPDMIRQAIATRVDGEPLFQCVQATWNVLEPSAGAALAEAKDAGWGVIVKEALANGRLIAGTEGGLLAEIASRHRVGADAIALAASLAQPFVDVVLSGATSPSQLRSNLAALAVDLTADDLERLRSMAQRPEDYWATRSTLPWH